VRTLWFPDNVHQTKAFLAALNHNAVDKTDSAGVKLVLNVSRFLLREFFRLKTVRESAEWDRNNLMQIQDDRLVLSDRCGVFLEIMLLLARRN